MSKSDDKLSRQKLSNSQQNLKLIKIYRIIAIVVAPIIAAFLFSDFFLEVDISLYQRVLLIYAEVMIIFLFTGSYFEPIRKNFINYHSLFLIGVMILNLYGYFQEPTKYRNESLILSVNLIGFSLIKPRITVVFYLIVLIVFSFFQARTNEVFPYNLLFMLLITAVVVVAYNYWRNQLVSDLDIAKKSYKKLFDNSTVHKFIISKTNEILDVNQSAEDYLKEKGVEHYIGLSLEDVFSFEDYHSKTDFEKALNECLDKGNAVFTANCIIGSQHSKVTPFEFELSRGIYFNKDVFIVNVKTIAAQKEFENELIRQKDNVTQILESIDYFVFNITYNPKEKYNHIVNFVSSKVKEIYDYSIEEYTKLIMTERIDEDRHPEDVAEVNKRFQKLLEKGGTDKWRFRMKVRGEWRWMEEKLFINKQKGKDTVALFGMVKDVTDSIMAERKLINSEKRYRQIFENNLAGVYKTHVNGEILDCNIAFAKILGYNSIEEVKKLNIQDVYYDVEDREPYIQLLRERKEVNNYISFLIRKDGRRLILNNNVSIIQDDRGEYNIIVGTVVDITELHETSQALLHSEEKYRLLFEESNNAIILVVVTDEDCFIIDANEMGSKMFGFSIDEMTGQTLPEILKTTNDSESLEQIIKSQKGSFEKELQFIKKDEEIFDAEVTFASIELENENVVQLVIKDISERKQYEKEILQSRLSFKNIVDRSPASVFIFTSGELAYINPKGEQLYSNVLNSKSRNIYDIFPKNTHTIIRDLIKEAESNINSYTELELGKGDNTRRYNINVVSVIYNSKKAILFLLMDITLQTEYNIQKLRAEIAEEANISLQDEIRRHKRTQRSLMESTSRLKALFETAAQLYIISIDKDFNLVSFNENFKKMIKNTLNIEVEIGMNFMDLFPIEKDAYTKIVEKFDKVLQGEPANLISHYLAQDTKKEIWIESFLSPIMLDGKEINEISFIAHDITEQIENRRRILDSEENNKALLLAIPDILFKANKEGIFTDFRSTGEASQRAFSRLLKTDEVIGKKIEDVLLDQKVAKSLLEHIKYVLKTGEIVTHNVSFEEKEEEGRIHYENRYSKINDDEVVIISRNVTDTVEYEEKLIESVKEKEVLLKEVHHRVKNNLQVINSILNLQSSYVKDDETLQIIIESQNRIRSMSYIHESLYQTKDFSSINFDDYISNLVKNLVHSYEVFSDKTQLDLKVDKVELALDQAIPCGLILNELITNALKYAYPKEKKGKITIAVWEEDGKVNIKVKDFGVGLPKNFKIEETQSLGLSLVDTLIDQLDGELILKTNNGTEFLIIFEKQEV